MSFWDSLGSGLQNIGQYANPMRLNQKINQGMNDKLNDMGLHPLAQVTTAPAAAVDKGVNQELGGINREGGYLAGRVPVVGNTLGHLANMGTQENGYQTMGDMKAQKVDAYNQNVMQPLAMSFGNTGAPASAGGLGGPTQPQSPSLISPYSAMNSSGLQDGQMGQGPMQAAQNWNPMAYGQKPQGLNQLNNGIQSPYIPPIQS